MLISRRYEACRLFGAAALACLTWARIDLAPAVSQPRPLYEVRSRVEGVVINERPVGRGQILVIDGEVDIAGTEACDARTLIRLPTPRDIPLGSAVVASARLHLPTPPPFFELFDEATWVRGQGIAFIGRSRSETVTLLAEPGIVDRVVALLTKGGRAAFDGSLSDTAAMIMDAMVMGNGRAVGGDLRSAFIRSGTAHMLAVSGTHVGIITAILVLLMGGRLQRWWTFGCVVAVTLFYVVLTGADPPAIRAALVFTLFALGTILQREPDVLNILGAVTLAEILLWPDMIIRPSFQLSLSATAFILFGMPRWIACLRRCFPRRPLLSTRLGAPLALNLTASAGVALPGALIFSQVALGSPLINFFVVPLFTLAMVGGILLLASSVLVPPLIPLLAWVVDLLVRFALDLIQMFDTIPLSHHSAAAPLVAIATTVALMWPSRSSSGRGLATRTMLGAALLSAVLMVLPKEQLGLTFVPVGTTVYVRARGSERTVILTLEERNGLPFVRSLHDRRSPP
jgi:competence protein ComEC